MPSQILRYLTDIEINNLTEEILLVDTKLWNHHINRSDYLSHGSLREGKSIYIKDQNHNVTSNFKYFKTAIEITKEYADLKNLGKFYLHRLTSNQKIYRHSDLTIFLSEKIKQRIQIYLSISKDTKITIDNKVQNNKLLEYSILNFDLKLPHEYINGNKTLYFFVFDILNII